MSNRTSILCVLGTALLIAIAGTIPEVDPITLWILSFVDGLPEFAWLRPYQLPPPANTEYGFRPLSVLMLKLYIYFFGTGAPPVFLIGCKAFLSATLLGMASWRWLRMHGMHNAAVPISCLVMMLGPHLFGLWSLVELDGIGAAAVLGVSLLMNKPEKEWLEYCSLAMLIAVAALLKESTALIVFAVMAAEVCISWREGKAWKGKLYWLLLSSVIWILWASALIFGVRSNVGGATWDVRIPLLFFTAWQLVFYASVPGCILLLGSLWKKNRLFFPVSCVVLMVLPQLVWINHYEAMYYAPFWLGACLCIVLYASLLWIACAPKMRKMHAGVAVRILFAKGALLFALLLSSSPREDLATRIFLPLAPLILGLIYERAWKERKQRSVQFLFVGFLGFSLLNGINTLIERRARGPVHIQLMSDLVQLDMNNSIILFNNFSFRLSKETISVYAGKRQDTPIVFVPDMLPEQSLPVVVWGNRFDVEERVEKSQKTFVYWSGLRALGESSSGNFSYTRRPLGAFAVLHREDGDRLPSHNYIEDMKKNTEKNGRSPLQERLSQVAHRDSALRNQFLFIDAQIFSWPQRILLGKSVMPSFSYDGEIWSWGQ